MFHLLLWLHLLLNLPIASGNGLARYILGGIAGDDGNFPHPDLPPDPAACEKIVNNSTDQFVYTASIIQQCLTSVPFDADVATRFMKYLNDTVQFQSTLAFLKDPPPEYQQKGVDIQTGINNIQQAIDSGQFAQYGQYAFEASVQRLLYLARDAHLNLYAGVLSAFSFGSPYSIVSISSNGHELPKVYFWDDVQESQSPNASWTPSAIKMINDQDVTEYLTSFADINSISVEPHGAWNQLMSSPALDILGNAPVFCGGAQFYPNDTLKFDLENGTSISVDWLGIYYSPGDEGIIETGQDFYDFFVLGLVSEPDASNSTSSSPSDIPSATTTDSSASTTTDSSSASSDTSVPDTPSPTAWNNAAYPRPDIFQKDLSTDGGGFITGYFLNESSIGVISIPSFQEYGDAIGTFSYTTEKFLRKSKSIGLQKIVIDLQQNVGGDALLAYGTFGQFFPKNEPFAGSRMRAHHLADTLGTTITGYFNNLNTSSDDYDALIPDEFVATDRLSAVTGQNFSDWGEFFGPHKTHNDDFSTVQRLNLSSELFIEESLGGFIPYGFGTESLGSAPYKAEDIIILTDGICASTCTLFVEFMRNVGVKTIVVGGRPIKGAMQYASGSRGARAYSSDLLDLDFAVAEQINQTTLALLPNRTDTGMLVYYLGINLRDQIRENANVPLQFLYEAADCRIFWTFETITNYSLLWKQAAMAAWTNQTICVEDSQGHTSKTNDTAPSTTVHLSSVSPSLPKSTSHYNIPPIATLIGIAQNPIEDVAQQTKTQVPKPQLVGNTCSLNAAGNTIGTPCPARSVCKSVTFCKGSVSVHGTYCVPSCDPRKSVALQCANGVRLCSRDSTKVDSQSGFSLGSGFCDPRPAKGSSCAAAPSASSGSEPQGVNPFGGDKRKRHRKTYWNE